MKRFLALSITTLLFLSAQPQVANAQFFKKLFGGKEEPRKPAPRPVVKKAEPPIPSKPKKKKRTYEYPASVLKQRYRVDVLLPLYLSEAVPNGKKVSKDNIPDKALSGINFYEGVKLAADSMSRLGYSVDVFIHDVTDAALTPEALVKGGILEESDLIIGSLSSNQLQPIADFAKRRQINFVSALSPSDGDVTNNPYFTILQPTLQKHCEAIRDIAFKKYPDAVPYLFYRSNIAVDSQAYSFILSDETKLFRKINCNSSTPREQIFKFLDSTKTNVVIMAVVDAYYAESLLQQLYTWFPRYQFEVYGMPSWKSMPNLRKPDAYQNVAVNFTAPFYFDPSTVSAQAMTQQYKREFGSSRPSEMVYRGYETLFWYVTLLNKYGTVFNVRQNDNAGAMFTKFDMKQQWSKNDELRYNMNERAYHYRYYGGSYTIQQ